MIPKTINKVSITYYPKVRLLTEADLASEYNEDDTLENDNSLNMSEIYIDDVICTTVIPYLVKAVMWQEFEPEMAQLERNKGLQNLMMIDDGADGVLHQTEVAHTHSWFL